MKNYFLEPFLKIVGMLIVFIIFLLLTIATLIMMVVEAIYPPKERLNVRVLVNKELNTLTVIYGDGGYFRDEAKRQFLVKHERRFILVDPQKITLTNPAQISNKQTYIFSCLTTLSSSCVKKLTSAKGSKKGQFCIIPGENVFWL